jgi:hypothetical protein
MLNKINLLQNTKIIFTTNEYLQLYCFYSLKQFLGLDNDYFYIIELHFKREIRVRNIVLKRTSLQLKTTDPDEKLI